MCNICYTEQFIQQLQHSVQAVTKMVCSHALTLTIYFKTYTIIRNSAVHFYESLHICSCDHCLFTYSDTFRSGECDGHGALLLNEESGIPILVV